MAETAVARQLDQLDRLFVLWSEPTDGTRHVIGQLWREHGQFAFGYVPEVDAAMRRGFELLPEFPDKRPLFKPYRSPYLFSTFAQRIPSPSRPDYARILRSWGVQLGDDPLEVLRLSGGVQVTDRLELAEYRSESDKLSRPLVFRVAGEKRCPGADLLNEGDPVVLAREADNQHDPNATLVLLRDGQRVGYVPRQYSAMIAKHLDAGHPLEAVALRRLVVPPERGRWQIRVRSPTAARPRGHAGNRALS
jgi:hypothetical protein